ncbi:Putative flippase GtrA (transmembrane translocase of bactoprenol-linked glucose) [Rhizobiales bacterium GAS191]|nr:Putative flippase GtrA (transmembrane translocase of bactoprenol-linked glucose) [Rhizobiales bacterium GAS113]SED55555.1 Putative flippase GtrA (transmembrane translocase of bactoprenol-linked glucose) [Rhizobiales bacterium GAS191]SEE79555.1 Putative flippase GtrA (transmembrane translocase of bactoprenol-linked glucose) [Rhizobiales bacterium GAS188]
MRLGQTRNELGKFLMFCAVGGVGFLVDAGLLLLATRGLGFGPLVSRAGSFTAAVIVTWRLNRSLTFGRHEAASFGEFTRYLSTQTFGLLCNLAIYTALVLGMQGLFGEPVVALTLASAVALAVNYLGMRIYVFQPR